MIKSYIRMNFAETAARTAKGLISGESWQQAPKGQSHRQTETLRQKDRAEFLQWLKFCILRRTESIFGSFFFFRAIYFGW